MTEQDKPSPELLPQALGAYKNEAVLTALRDSDWFTPAYIIKTRQEEPYPSFSLETSLFSNQLLSDFFLAGHLSGGVLAGKDCSRYFELLNFLNKATYDSQGHPYPLNQIEFLTEAQISQIELDCQVSPQHLVDRAMFGTIPSMLQCLIAPDPIRKPAIKAVCSWREGAEARKADVLAFSQVIRFGALAFLERTPPSQSGNH